MKKTNEIGALPEAVTNAAYEAAGTNVKKLRELQPGFTQEYLASVTGMSRSRICRLENGKTKLELKTLMVIAAAVYAPVSDILKHELFTGINDLTDEARNGN
jgi:transcriptional regulator with XRE-family HTH domain